MCSSIREIVCGLSPDLYSEFFVVMLKAFVDDSGSGGDSPWFVLAGYLSSVKDWDAFDDDWKTARDAPRATEYFKGSEAESLKGQFLGFNRMERDAKIEGFIDIVQRRVRHAIYVRVKQKHYNRIIKANVPPVWDNAYYFLFPAFIAACVTLEKYFGSDDPVEFVFDNQQRFERPSKRLYGHMQDMAMFHGYIANVFYRDEKKFLPLQAADLLAWQVRRRFSVSREKRRPQFETAQKCLGTPPSYNRIMSESDLHDMLKAMQESAFDLAEALGFKVDEQQPWKIEKP